MNILAVQHGTLMFYLVSQLQVEEQLRLVEYSARYAVGVFLDSGPWKDMEWGMKYFSDPVIRYIVINGGHTATGMQNFLCHVVNLSHCLCYHMPQHDSRVFHIVQHALKV